MIEAVKILRYPGGSAEPGAGETARGPQPGSGSAACPSSDASRLNELATAAAAEAFVFLESHRGLPSGTLAAAGEELKHADGAAGVVVTPPGDDLARRCWRELPASIATLARPWPETGIVCIRAAAWEQTGRFPDGPDPLWRWMVAAASQGKYFTTASAAYDSDVPLPDDHLPPLAPASPPRDRQWLIQHLRSLSSRDLVPEAASPPDAIALQAGLLQLHDALDASHELSQSIEGRGRHRAGDYWHAIMHRREPDDSNAKYWFRQLGRHPVFAELAPAADAILANCDSPEAGRWRERLGAPSDWDPFAFIDLCAHCRRSGGQTLETAARRIQLTEMLLLLIHTWRAANGRS